MSFRNDQDLSINVNIVDFHIATVSKMKSLAC